MPSMVFGVFLRAIYTFKTLNCTVAYGLWGDFWHLGGGGMAPLAPPKSAYGVKCCNETVAHFHRTLPAAAAAAAVSDL